MQKPQINLNGSGGMELACQYQEAANALDNALHLMRHLVHGRDYQTLPYGSLARALAEMTERTGEVMKVRDELLEIARHCAEQSR